jgi:hypothetical protein
MSSEGDEALLVVFGELVQVLLIELLCLIFGPLRVFLGLLGFLMLKGFLRLHDFLTLLSIQFQILLLTSSIPAEKLPVSVASAGAVAKYGGLDLPYSVRGLSLAVGVDFLHIFNHGS